MKYLRNHHQIAVKSNQAQSLWNIGYYHRYKGCRFVRTPNHRILFSSLNEVIVLNEFFDTNRPIPILTVFESLTLGEFGTFFAYSNSNVKLKTSIYFTCQAILIQMVKLSNIWFMISKICGIQLTITTFIFDARFQTSKISRRLVSLLETEVEITGLDFKYIDAYIIPITCILRKMATEIGGKKCEKIWSLKMGKRLDAKKWLW